MANAQEIELVFEPQDEGGYHVYAPDLPGFHTQGDDLDDARSRRLGLNPVARLVSRGRAGRFTHHGRGDLC